MPNRIEAGLPRLIEDVGVPVIYCDGPAKAFIEGSNVRIVFFEYRRIEGERVRVGVLEMVRPLASVQMGNIVALIAAARAEDGLMSAAAH
jgi:hypothetical protein